jgi:hypothetical protein
MAKLKVYRTPIGFHDAYVAASSQKAALQAWGSDRDLFARGVAEVVTDPDLAAEALARPGTVIKRSRGSAAEQIAALPPTPPRRARAEPAEEPERRSGKKPRPTRRPKAAPAPAPKPDRSALADAEHALTEAAARHRRADRTLRAEEEALARRRRTMERDQQDERERLEATRATASDAYARALRRWRG